MNPWQQLDVARMPGNGGDLRLMQRAAEYSIMLGTTELMNSRLSGSEEALAVLSCRRLEPYNRPHILIGGLGMGFTLRAAQNVLPADARITVAELVPAVIDWARGAIKPVFGDCLEDSRTTIWQGDVGSLIANSEAMFDAILLDVDNGPEGLTRRANDDIYASAGLRAAQKALRPGGILSVWSSAPDPGFTQRLGQAGFKVEEIKTRANGKRGARHVIWMAKKA
ncbi:hypothetical protein PSQ90_11070 [Devosia rhodophyticola]|uniref:Spermidine synthase n=1 Tax=Devosia rhodophyticola TaxID=3026423 RepID=A0ABY7YTY9_9HYPH|nr:hypothetical protein [Devosia rhodophyticola]WDR04848.1 hypothetical protein PSQ90_11070 [Devosia rhodophyticola]